MAQNERVAREFSEKRKFERNFSLMLFFEEKAVESAFTL
jgi:hypothetical protein